MFPKISPRNNDWNRKHHFNDDNGFGFYIEDKNGMTHFAWKFADGSIKYYNCEQSLFEKGFSITTQTTEHKLDQKVNAHYLRYPVEI